VLGLPPRLESIPIYPAMYFLAWIVTVYASSTASLHALGRPLLVGLLVVVALQLAFSAIARNRYLGAALVMVLFSMLVGMHFVALIVCFVLIALTVWSIHRRRGVASLPWAPFTRLLNIVATVTLVLGLLSAGQAGSLTPTVARDTERGVPSASLPDIYLVLLDGYPRSDTLEADFEFDNEPFLDQMTSMGFDVSRQSHSNYNLTWFSLASMFNMAQVHDLSAVRASTTQLSEIRALQDEINRGRGLVALELAGYEIISIPSASSSTSLSDADRVLTGGQVSDFEHQVLQEGLLPALTPDVVREWLLGQHRERTLETFDRIADLAAERVGHPRFVFAHLLAPHVPVVFGPNGEPRDGWPCFPQTCGIYDAGHRYGVQIVGPMRDQVEFINKKVVQAADQILARGAREAIVVFLSDHGSRFDIDNPDEMLRSFLVARTPGHPRLFPDDATPVNILPRILNAYAAAAVPLATEESYLVDLVTVQPSGPPVTLIPWVISDE